MLALMKKNKKLEDDDGENAFGAGRDPYDALFAQLGLQGSGAAKKVAMERLKTDDEIVAEEKERLEKLEANRVSRMRGDVAETSPDVGDKVGSSIGLKVLGLCFGPFFELVWAEWAVKSCECLSSI